MSLIEIETPDTRNRIGVQTESGAGVSPHADPDAREVGAPHVQDGSGSATSPALSSDRGRSGTSSVGLDAQVGNGTHPRCGAGPAIPPVTPSDIGRRDASSADPDIQTWSDTHPRRETGPAISSTPPDTIAETQLQNDPVAGGVALSPTTVPEVLAAPIKMAAQVVGLAGGAADAKSLPEGVAPLTPAGSSCPPPVMNSEPGDEAAAGHNLVEGPAGRSSKPVLRTPVLPALEGGTAIEGEEPDNYTPFPLELDLLTLRMWAATYDAASRNKMATDARFRELTNLQQHLPGADVQQKFASQQKAHARRMLFAAYQRAFPTIYGWAVNVPGLATSSDLAWLLALTGDPRVKQPYIRLETEPAGHVCCEKCGPGKHLVALEETPRTVSQLWSYCGHGAAIKRRKGMTAAEALAGGNTMAKTLSHRLAEACMKMPGGVTSTGKARKRSPYRDMYDSVRAKVEGREDWTDGHKHNHAVRLTAKAILKDLWLVQHGLTPTYGATS